ncbi:MAG: hypothetical protein U0457_12890 [Candidatus Sericytochromatia bacterium]
MSFIEDKETFENIIFTFKDLYKEKKSLSNISLQEIADKSDIHIGKIYSLFNGKTDVAIALIENIINEIFITFDEESEKDTPLGDKLKIALSLQLEFLGPHADLINELTLSLVNPFSEFSNFVNKLKNKYINFLTELLENNFKGKNLIRTLTIPLIVRSFLVFNVTVIKYWEADKSEGKKNTLSFIENGVKNFMVVSALL